LDEVGAAVLDAGVGELSGWSAAARRSIRGVAYIQRGQLDVGVLVADALLQRAHGIFRLHRLGPNHVGDLEVQRHVLAGCCQYSMLQLAARGQYAQARGRGALDLLIEGAVRRGAEPARHGVGRIACSGRVVWWIAGVVELCAGVLELLEQRAASGRVGEAAVSLEMLAKVDLRKAVIRALEASSRCCGGGSGCASMCKP
jgi:hypothetical protein